VLVSRGILDRNTPTDFQNPQSINITINYYVDSWRGKNNKTYPKFKINNKKMHTFFKRELLVFFVVFFSCSSSGHESFELLKWVCSLGIRPPADAWVSAAPLRGYPPCVAIPTSRRPPSWIPPPLPLRKGGPLSAAFIKAVKHIWRPCVPCISPLCPEKLTSQSEKTVQVLVHH